MSDTMMEKLDYAIKELETIKAEITALKGVALVAVTPTVTSGLYRFVKPSVRNISQWPADRDMTSADADEAFKRALHGVNWRGGYVADQTYAEAWDEIEALKSGNQELIEKYLDLDPEFAGFGLLTGLFSVTKWDKLSFGQNIKNRKSYAGYTIQSFMDTQMSIVHGGGAPSGG